MVVINKVDRQTARIQEVESEIFDLFVDMNVPDEMMDYKVFYASGRSGWAVDSEEKINDEEKNVYPIFESIVNDFAPPKVFEDQSDF